MTYVIRPIQPQDNQAVEMIIVSVLKEHGCIGDSYASNDAETQAMFENYQAPRTEYWVVEDAETAKVVGACGFAPLVQSPREDMCELRKFYFLPEARGTGVGRVMYTFIENRALQAGFRYMYLESVEHLQRAINMYRRNGYHQLNTYLGDTGHHPVCAVRMVKAIAPDASLDVFAEQLAELQPA